jgi:hypothetical protein
MKQVFAGTFMAAAFAVGLAAQAPAPQSQPPTTPQSQPPMADSKDAGKNVTVTGCLKAGDTADSFTLSDLKWKDDKAVGTSGSAAPASLKVIGSPSAKLSDHVGHIVELTGSIDKGDKAAACGATDPAARPSASASSSPSLNARNVKMVAATCQ